MRDKRKQQLPLEKKKAFYLFRVIVSQYLLQNFTYEKWFHCPLPWSLFKFGGNMKKDGNSL